MASKDKKAPKSSNNRNDRIRTLADLNRPSGPDSDSDSDSPREYYTGGEKSGMIVQDPTKKKDVDEIFNQARQSAVDDAPIGGLHSSSTVTGTGRLLSGEIIPDSSSQEPEPQWRSSITHEIVFWRNGFTVNDGPLRRIDDPENYTLLESITKSECPKELEPADRKCTVHVRLTRKDENYSGPERRTVWFQGVGRTLGGNSDPTFEFATASSSSTPPTAKLVLDETKPSTSIQLRLADGTRLVAHFNHHHTIGDIRGFIDSSRPEGNRSYQLQTVGFPPKQLNDLSQTIEQAGLANSVIVQKH